MYGHSPRPDLLQEQPAQIVAMIVIGKNPCVQMPKPIPIKKVASKFLERMRDNEKGHEGASSPAPCAMEPGSCPAHLIDRWESEARELAFDVDIH